MGQAAQCEMNLNGHSVEWVCGTVQVPWLSLVEQFASGQLCRPAHQREKVWTRYKTEQLIRCLQEGKRVKAGILLYFIKGNPHALFLNDGLQRLLALLEYFEHPNLYGDSVDQAKLLLTSQVVTRDIDVYDSHADALEAFCFVNGAGTELTPYEMCHGVLAYMDQYEQKWASVIDEIETSVEANAHKVVPTFTRSRVVRHKYRRDSYALFLRSALEQGARKNLYPDASTSKINDIASIREGATVEGRLKEFLESMPSSDVERHLTTFVGRLKFFAGEIKTAADKTEEVDGIREVVFRWMLAVLLWGKSNGVDMPRTGEFIESFLRVSKGKTPFVCGEETLSVSVQKVDVLEKVCKAIGSDFHEGRRRRKHKAKESRHGMDDHHPDPFVVAGDGPTVSIPARHNQSTGARASA